MAFHDAVQVQLSSAAQRVQSRGGGPARAQLAEEFPVLDAILRADTSVELPPRLSALRPPRLAAIIPRNAIAGSVAPLPVICCWRCQWWR